jgi:tetratricopeptide (TPR) repeat protein
MSQGTAGGGAPAREYARADACERAGDIDGAVAIFRSLLQRFPNEPLLMNRLALALKAKGALDEAEALLRRAIGVLPGEASLHNNLGNVLRERGVPTEAAASYRTAVGLQPAYPEAHFNLGIALEEQGLLADASEAVTTAVKLRPDYYQALTRLAVLSYQRGEFETALAQADRALAVNRGFFDALYYRGLILSALDRYDEALDTLRRAQALRPQSFEAGLAVANNLLKSDRSDEALGAFWGLIEQKPERAATHYEFNRIAWSSGRQDLFLRSFTYARERGAQNADLLLSEAEFRFRRNEPRVAETLLRQAHALAPEQPGVSAALARTLARLHQYDESSALFEAAIRGEPSNVASRNEYGTALLIAGDARRALNVFDQARAIAPDDQLLLAGSCLALRSLGDSRYAALVDFDKYVRAYDITAPAGFPDVAAFNRALTEELYGLHTLKVEPIDQTLRGGTQTSGLLFNKPSRLVAAVREKIEAAVADYIGMLPHDPAHPTSARVRDEFSFTHSWSCKLRSDGYHSNHVHPMGWISSAYYVSLPDEMNEATRAGWLKFGESNLALGESDRPENAVQPVVGRLVLFPSFYWHGTFPFASSRDRLTIAFDVVPGRVSAVGAPGPY